MHLDEERLERLRHGELSPGEERSAREHLAACEHCRGLAELAEREEAEVFARLRALDDPAPAISADTIAALAERRVPSESAPRPILGRLAWAAGFVLLLGLVGLGYALPGSPLRAWVATIAHWVGERGAPEPSPPVSERATNSGLAGISVAPGAELTISFLAPLPRTRLRLAWSEGAEVEILGPRGAATFTSGAGTLQIDNRQPPATFEIRIPRASPRIEIVIDGARAFLEEDGKVIEGALD